mgnify:CR=1 FL=1
MAETRRSAPIAERLADLMGQQITDGVYQPGDKLPSLRELAQLHRYAKNTVVSAFDLLVSRGMIEPRRGSGFYVSQQLRKAEEQLRRRARHYLALPVEGGMRRLDSSLIYYLESEGHRVHFYTEEGDFVAAGTLKAFEEKLAERPFARCNSGYLVNLAQVRELRQSTVQVGPCELQVSRPKRKGFLAALTDYIGGEGS